MSRVSFCVVASNDEALDKSSATGQSHVDFGETMLRILSTEESWWHHWAQLFEAIGRCYAIKQLSGDQLNQFLAELFGPSQMYFVPDVDGELMMLSQVGYDRYTKLGAAQFNSEQAKTQGFSSYKEYKNRFVNQSFKVHYES